MKKLLFLLLIISACAGDDENPKPVYRIDPAFQIQVDAFYAEALARGHGELPEENLIVEELTAEEVLENPELNASGYSYKKKGQNVVKVRVMYPVNCQEAMVFRELAHLYLDKPYSNNDNHIMSQSFSPCTYVHADGDFYPWREEYMVELFGE